MKMNLKSVNYGSKWLAGDRKIKTLATKQIQIRENVEEEMEGEEDDNYKHLREQMSRIYTSAPTDFTIIDRSRRNSVVVGRDGFDELYMFSPGSSHEDYGKYAYICVSQSAVLKPEIVSLYELWRGGQRLQNSKFSWHDYALIF